MIKFTESTLEAHEKFLTSLGMKLKKLLDDRAVDKVLVALDKFYSVFPEDFIDASRINTRTMDAKKDYWGRDLYKCHQLTWNVSVDIDYMGKPKINYKKESFGYAIVDNVFLDIFYQRNNTVKFQITVFGDKSEDTYELHNRNLQVEFEPSRSRIHGSTTPTDAYGQDYEGFFTYKNLKANKKAWDEIVQTFNKNTSVGDLSTIVSKYGDWLYTYYAMD